MAESTAGIGEAGALVNRAKAPATMDITRGVQMAQNSALKRAQLEAARLSKQEAIKQKMAKMSKVNTGKYKNVGVAKEAQEKALDLFARKSAAIESGDYVAAAEMDIEASYLGNYLASKDEAINKLKSPKKYDYAKKVGQLIDEGKEEEAAKMNKAYAPVFVKGEMGDYSVEVPDAVDLNKVYSNVLKSAFRNEITFGSLADAATGTDNYSVKRKMTDNEIAVTADALMREEGYLKGVVYNPDFQKFYDKKYGGSADPAAVDNAVFEYTKKRIGDINQEKLTVKGRSDEDKFVYSTGSGIKIGGKELTIDDLSGQEVFDLTYGNIGVEKGKEGAEGAMANKMKQMIASNPNAQWKKTNIPDIGEITITDITSGKTENVNIKNIYSSGGESWVVYSKKNISPQLPDLLVVTPMTNDIFNRLYNKMAGSKKGGEMQGAIKAFNESGVDLSRYAKKIVNIKESNTGGGKPIDKNKKQTPKKKINLGVG